MKNSIHISVDYSFKGETFSPSAVIDLDSLATKEERPDFHALLARLAGIDTYSYAFEVMQQTALHFSQATGLAGDYLHDGDFDFAGFAAAAREERIVQQLQDIAIRVLDIDDLKQHPRIKEALLQAFRLGNPA